MGTAAGRHREYVYGVLMIRLCICQTQKTLTRKVQKYRSSRSQSLVLLQLGACPLMTVVRKAHTSRLNLLS